MSLTDLPDAAQVDLTEAMGSLCHIDHATSQSVIAEFLSELDGTGPALSAGVAGALDLKDRTLGGSTIAHLRDQAGMRPANDPWRLIAGLDCVRLLPAVQEESIEIGAIVLSKLKVSTAAELLGLLPRDRARQITFALSQIGAILPDTVRKIGEALVVQLNAQTPSAFRNSPAQRLGEILNSSSAEIRDDVLADLQAKDEKLAEQVRRAIFTFANIPERIDRRDVPKIARNIETLVLITALSAAASFPPNAEAAKFILTNMSQRLANQLREDMEMLGQFTERDGESAMAAVVATIQEMASDGDILLVTPDA